jgi:2,4-didehydro-3-deoxy-L-rhamnonate hydrolase
MGKCDGFPVGEKKQGRSLSGGKASHPSASLPMKLIRWGEVGAERPGIIDQNGLPRDASGFGEDWNEAFFGMEGLSRLKTWLASQGETLPLIPEGARLGSCVARPSKLICIGLNYAAHAAETGKPLPIEPLAFMKSSTALCGPNDPVELPPGSETTDWEVEFAFVIGRTARRVSEAEALSYVAGYCLLVDFSERDWQNNRGGQWVKGKSFDTFAPAGPWLLTADEVADPQSLGLWLKVNGQVRQQSSTADMIFPVSLLLSHLSQCMTLLPGDIISTGTPSGVGHGMKPPTYLKESDLVEAGIDNLGTQSHRAVATSLGEP